MPDPSAKTRTLNHWLECFYLPLIGSLFFLTLHIFWPGQMSPDSHNQWDEAFSGLITDMHPPMMAWWWRMLMIYVTQDRAVLLVFHLLVYWSAIYFIGRSLGPSSILWAYALAAVWLAPPVMGMLGILWKDTGMTVCWMLSSGLILYAMHQERRPSVLSMMVIVPTLFYGAAARHNGLLGALPLCFMLVMSLRLSMRPRMIAVATLAMFAALSGSVFAFNKAVSTHMPFELVVLQLDISRIGKRVGVPLYPDSLPTLPREIVRVNEGQKKQIYDLYRSTILTYPAAFLAVHWDDLRRLLRLGMQGNCEPFYWDFQIASSPANQRAGAYLKANSDSWWYKGFWWVFLPLKLGLAFLLCRKEHAALAVKVVPLCASALLVIAPLFVMSPWCDFRYLYWSMMVTVMVLLLIGSELHRQYRGKRKSV